MNPVDRIFEIFRAEGHASYGNERVLQTEHALQCALMAEQCDAPSYLIAAALLHDIGHLSNPDDRAAASRGEDGRHENTGCKLLSPWFGPEVTDPVKWHVAAKRYLTATEPEYFAKLSKGSVRSLELQGGRYDRAEAEHFIQQPYAHDAVLIRRWDDRAKVPGLETPPLAHFRDHLSACLRAT